MSNNRNEELKFYSKLGVPNGSINPLSNTDKLCMESNTNQFHLAGFEKTGELVDSE